jgi:hypothetical protein
VTLSSSEVQHATISKAVRALIFVYQVMERLMIKAKLKFKKRWIKLK